MAAMMIRNKPTVALRANAVPAVRLARRALVVRASAEPPKTEAAPSTPAVSSAETITPAAPVVSPASKGLSFGDAMAFAGPAPETINGRLAMLGIVAAIGAELATGESVLTQFASAPAVVLTTWALIAVASLVPILKGAAKGEAFGPLTPNAELTNGRMAMIGLAGLLIVELTKGSALF